MAKVIQNEQKIVVEPWWAKEKIVYIGLGLGAIWWILGSILRQYVIEPIACRSLESAAACVNSTEVAGSVAAVLVAVAGVLLLIRYLQPRPIIIAIATAALLWNLAALTLGLPGWATFLMALFFYAASYTLFSLVARIPWVWISSIVAAVLVVVMRLLIAL